MAKFKITLKRDASLSSDTNDGDNGRMKIAGVEEAKKEVIVTSKWCTEAIVQATKGNYGFYPIAWECVEEDVKTPDELKEEADNKKFLEEWAAKNANNGNVQ